MKKYAPLLALFAILVVAGCSKPTVVGQWTGTANVGSTPLQMDADFAADNKFTLTIKASAMGQSVTNVQKGTWKMEESGENKSLTLTVAESTLNGQKLNIAGAKPQSGPIKFDKETFTWSAMLPGGQTTEIVFTKKK